MKVYTLLVLDLETCRTLAEQSYEWDGCVALCKGGNSERQQNIDNQRAAAQLQLQQQQLALQQAQIGMANAELAPIIKAGGLSPATLAAMQSSFLTGLPAQYNNLEGALLNRMTQQGAAGGTMPPSGALTREFGQLGQQEAFQQARGLNDIQLEKEQGLRNAIAMQMGLIQPFTTNVGTFGQGATGFSGQATNAAQAADTAQASFMGSLFGALASPFQGTGFGLFKGPH